MFYHLKLSQPETKELSSIMVTSAEAGEGKSIFSLVMALGISKEIEERCLLVDANWINPTLHNRFNVKRSFDIATFWDDPSACVQDSNIDNLDILAAPIGVEADSGDEPAKSETVRKVFAQLTDRYKTVVFDTSPILKKTEVYGQASLKSLDPLILSDFVQASILVIMARKTNKQSVKKAKFSLQKDNNEIWAILNNFQNPFYQH
jgi:non-specific protein-tyrosine kinase